MKSISPDDPASPPPVPTVTSPVDPDHPNHDADPTEEIQEEEEVPRPKSPLLTSHRISTESLDNINLDDGVDLDPKSPPIGRSRGAWGMWSDSDTLKF
jgi:hypothetical protein